MIVYTGFDGHIYYQSVGCSYPSTPIDTSFAATSAPAVTVVGSGNDYLFVAAPGYQHQLYLNQGYLGGSFNGSGRT